MKLIEQLANNFGAINSEADEFVNPFLDLLLKLGDIAIGVSETVLPVFTIPLVDFLDRNQVILGGLLVTYC